MDRIPPTQSAEYARMFAAMAKSHGRVIPRPDGQVAKCMGPDAGCYQCMLERLVFNATGKIAIIEGFVLNPGAKLLIVCSDPRVKNDDLDEIRKSLDQRFPEVEITVLGMPGITAIQVQDDKMTTFDLGGGRAAPASGS